MKKKILLLGATGSIGQQTQSVLEKFPNHFSLVGISGHKNINGLLEVAKKFRTQNIAITDSFFRKQFSDHNKNYTLFSTGVEMAQSIDFDLLVISTLGEVDFSAIQYALEHKKEVALATKELLLLRGEEIMSLAQKQNITIRPIDSEHSAIWQCLRGRNISEVEKIWLTASGGPFRDSQKWPLEKMFAAKKEDVLAHPTWNMGKKISVDSASMMNKAFEFLEIMFLFGVGPEKIEVVVHPQSLMHSAVAFRDGQIVAHISEPDMRISIAHALFFPEHCPFSFSPFSFFGKNLSFFPLDSSRFPAILWAKKAFQHKRVRDFVRINDAAVFDFLAEKISFGEIFHRLSRMFP